MLYLNEFGPHKRKKNKIIKTSRYFNQWSIPMCSVMWDGFWVWAWQLNIFSHKWVFWGEKAKCIWGAGLVFILETNMETYFDTRGRSIISKIVASNGRASFQQTANRGWPALSTDDGWKLKSHQAEIEMNLFPSIL